MARPIFEIKEQYLGTGALADYTFDFKIGEADEILLIMLDASGVEVARQRGNDTTILVRSIVFDDENGGGTVTLLANLVTDYTLIMLLANDAPTQPFEFRSKGSFTLRAFENALDWVAGAVQRVSWLSNRSIRMNDIDEGSDFDPQLPAGLQANRVIMVNPTGTGLVQGPTPAELAQASSDASAVAANALIAAAAATTSTANALSSTASAAAAAASAVAANASAVAAAASAASFAGFIHTGPFAAIAPNANANLTSETTNSLVNTMVDYTARIVRGTGTWCRQEFTIMYRNGAWKIVIGPGRFDDAGLDHGVTFTVDAVTGQINAAVANDGGSNAVIDLNKLQWAV